MLVYGQARVSCTEESLAQMRRVLEVYGFQRRGMWAPRAPLCIFIYRSLVNYL